MQGREKETEVEKDREEAGEKKKENERECKKRFIEEQIKIELAKE